MNTNTRSWISVCASPEEHIHMQIHQAIQPPSFIFHTSHRSNFVAEKLWKEQKAVDQHPEENDEVEELWLLKNRYLMGWCWSLACFQVLFLPENRREFSKRQGKEESFCVNNYREDQGMD